MSDTTQSKKDLEVKIADLEAQLKESQKRIRILNIIGEVDRSLTLELNLDPLLHKILAGAVKVTDASAGSLLLLDEINDELVFAVVEGGGGDSLQGTRIASDKGIAGWVATNRQPLIVDDVNKDNRYYHSIAANFDFKLTSLICVPMISRNKLIGVLQVMQNTPGCYFGTVEQELLNSFASKAAISIENARLYKRLKEERDKLVIVEDEVRKRLARDLHDGPTQFVAAMIMNLDFIKELIARAPEYAPDEIEKTVALARKTLKQLRTLLFNLRPVILETQGLIPALEVYTERLRETDKLKVHLNVKQEFARLSSRAEIATFAVIQEAVNNAKKYARTSDIKITIQPDEEKDLLTVLITDNGKGFDVQAVRKQYDKRGSLGMINMQERIEAINGRLKIQSEIGQGTEVSFTLPLHENLLENTKEL
ncbi:MAG: GAF domain-containing sensor histidine kinase [Anaerolineae bacterium]|nr:GAF domain-containing sensor histidine kinase [Anaerolineae bacterium]